MGVDDDMAEEEDYGPRDLSELPPVPPPARTGIGRLIAAIRGSH